MQLDDLKFLGVAVKAGDEQMFQKRLNVAIAEAKAYCNNPFLNEAGVEEIPDGAQMGIALLVKSIGETQNVASQSLGDMSKSFFEGGTAKAAYKKLKPYRKVGFR